MEIFLDELKTSFKQKENLILERKRRREVKTMNTDLMENQQMVDEVASQIVNQVGQVGNKNGFGYEEPVINLGVSKKELKKIEAAAFYNDYDSIEEYLRDLVFREIELDKERHLKGKESKDTSKLKK